MLSVLQARGCLCALSCREHVWCTYHSSSSFITNSSEGTYQTPVLLRRGFEMGPDGVKKEPQSTPYFVNGGGDDDYVYKR